MTASTDQTIDLLNAPMPRRELLGTGFHASVLTIGGVKWDTQIPEGDAVALLHRAIELGVNTFDTAAGYGNGQSEQRLGLALEGHRDNVWINTKTGKRDYDGARQDMDTSLDRLKTDHIDLMFVHGIDNEEDRDKILAPDGVLRAVTEYRDAGHIRHIGLSGHWYKHNMAHAIQAFPFEAVLMPVGLFNDAYGYSFIDEVGPIARERGIAVLGMKIMGAGRAKHAVDPGLYLRYAINQDIDTAVLGHDSIEQLEHNVRTVKAQLPHLSEVEAQGLYPEAKAITQTWDAGEFNWVSHYI